MAFIFMDESGDLGFDFNKPKTSNFFIITLLFTKRREPLEKIVKKVFSGLRKKEIKHHSGTLHCYKEHPKTRIKLLNLLRDKDVSVISIYLNKRKVYTRLQNEKPVLYNYVTNILLDRVFQKKLIPLDSPIELIASKRETNRFLNDNFKGYLEDQVKLNHKHKISIEIKYSGQDKGLQVVDFVCWSIFRRKERNDEFYYNLIKTKVVEENPLFP